ncbi:MAG TPA: energy transducer TonB [Sphingobacterium sp.]|nr:energy transducer TonB [Sphingobacterium sp.]
MKFITYASLVLGCLLIFGSFTRLPAVRQQEQDSIAFREFDVAPQFRGGSIGWQRFLQNNLDIREAIRAIDSTAYVEYGLRQTALLEFTICEDGKVCEIVITNKHNISPEFAKEALRVMNHSPKWIPAQANGQPVRTRIRQSITAILGN